MRVKPLAFWANQRLSRDALAIDQGFSDQLAQQCHSFVQQPRQRLAAPSPAKAQPGSGDKALSGSQSDPPSSKPAAPQKGGKTVRFWVPSIPVVVVSGQLGMYRSQ